MLKVSEIISLPVINILDGNIVGVSTELLFDLKQKKCKYLIITNEEDYDIKYAVCCDNIYKIGENSILIKNNTALNLYNNIDLELQKYYLPINSKAYDINGKYLGIINDIIINEKYQIQSFETNNSITIDSQNILNFNNKLLLTKDKSNIVLSNFKNKSKIKTLNVPNSLTTIEQKQNNTPQKATTNYNFLLNRTTTKDIKNQNGEVIIKTNTLITKSVINKLNMFGKLIECAKNSN